MIPAISFDVSGVIPVVSGYTMLARVEHTLAGNIITSFDDDFDWKAWVNAENHCDHCNQNRKRRDTFVLVKDGEIKQIGRTCLSDYLRTDDVNTIVDMFIFWASFEKDMNDIDGDWGDGYPSYHSVLDVVTASCASVRQFGFVGKSVDFGKSTFTHCLFLLNPPKMDSSMRAEWERQQPTEADKEQAERVIEWVAKQEANSGYMHNLIVACELGYVTERTMGLVVSAVSSYKKAMGEELYKKKEAPKESNYVGKVGDRVDIEADLTVSKVIESQWGLSWFVVFVDDNGNIYSGFVPFRTLEGIPDTATRFKIRGTVKDHTVYNDKKQTVLNRMKLEGVR